MILYDTENPAPNPRRVRVYLAEKGITVPTKHISIEKGEQKSPEYLNIHPLGQTPALQLDDGSILSESLSICRYFEALHPEKPLFGSDPKMIGEIDMWVRRVEMRYYRYVAMVWYQLHPFMAKSVTQYKAYGENQRLVALTNLGEFNEILKERPWVAGEDYTMADIMLLTTIDFAKFIGEGIQESMDIPENYEHLLDWYKRTNKRPSALA